MKIFNFRYFHFFSIFVLLYGCAKGDHFNIPLEESKLSVELDIPISLVGAPTRSIGIVIDEDLISDVTVFFMKKGNSGVLTDEIVLIEKGESIDGNKFDVDVPFPNDTEEYYFHVVANIDTKIDNAELSKLKGKTYTELHDLLQSESGSLSSNTNLPMWGLYSSDKSFTAGTMPRNIAGVKLIRSLARLDVGVGQRVNGVWNGKKNNATSNVPFKLKGVEVYSTYDKYSFTPSSSEMMRINGLNYDLPTMAVTEPSHVGNIVASGHPSYSTNNTGDTVSPDYSITQIYIPEALVKNNEDSAPNDINHTTRCGLIISGYYDSSNELTYYRVDFKGSSSSLINVLRNHHYLINITDVNGIGYDSPADAYRGQTMNMETTVVEWTVSEGEVYFDGTNRFSLESGEITLYGASNVSKRLKVSSSVPLSDWEMAWSDDISLISIPYGKDNTVSCEEFSVTKSDEVLTFMTVKDSPATKYLHMRINNLKFVITVKQGSNNDDLTVNGLTGQENIIKIDHETTSLSYQVNTSNNIGWLASYTKIGLGMTSFTSSGFHEGPLALNFDANNTILARTGELSVIRNHPLKNSVKIQFVQEGEPEFTISPTLNSSNDYTLGQSTKYTIFIGGDAKTSDGTEKYSWKATRTFTGTIPSVPNDILTISSDTDTAGEEASGDSGDILTVNAPIRESINIYEGEIVLHLVRKSSGSGINAGKKIVNFFALPPPPTIKWDNGITTSSVSNFAIAVKGLSKGYNWTNAMKECPTGWEVPSINQLRLMYIYSRYIEDKTTDFTSDKYWSATIYGDNYRTVNFSGGASSSTDGTNEHYVRCVKKVDKLTR